MEMKSIVCYTIMKCTQGLGGSLLAEDKNPKNEEKDLKKDIMLYLHDLVYVLSAIVVVMLLVFRLVVVSGSSMYDTLKHGDYLLLLSNTFYQEPEPGDIVVISKESFDNGAPIVKRVIATEGQTVDIDFEEGIVYVDGDPLEEPYTYTPTNNGGGVEFPLTVYEGFVFVLGDNRNGSRDSRYPEIGLIDEREIIGKAIFLMLPGGGAHGNEVDFGRIGVIS